MRKTLRILALVLLVSIPIADRPSAESTPEALEWLEKMAAIHEKGPFRVNYSATMNVTQMGQAMGMEFDGKLTQADPKRMRMDFSVKMTMPGMQAPMDMGVLTVADGETMWMEMQNPMLGGTQVMKLPVDQMEKLAEANPGMGFGGQMSGVDPVSQVEQMTKMFDFELVGVEGGKVTLRAEMTEETASQFKQFMIPGPGLSQFVLILEEKTAFPTEMRMGGDEPLMVMRFTDLEFLDADALDPAIFTYAPPEGIQVMDLGAMLEIMAGQGDEPQ